MGAITTAMGIAMGMTGAGGRSRIIFGPREPLSFDQSLWLGIVVGVIVCLLYTFNTWPYFQDIWGRPPKGERQVRRPIPRVVIVCIAAVVLMVLFALLPG